MNSPAGTSLTVAPLAAPSFGAADLGAEAFLDIYTQTTRTAGGGRGNGEGQSASGDEPADEGKAIGALRRFDRRRGGVVGKGVCIVVGNSCAPGAESPPTTAADAPSPPIVDRLLCVARLSSEARCDGGEPTAAGGAARRGSRGSGSRRAGRQEAIVPCCAGSQENSSRQQ